MLTAPSGTNRRLLRWLIRSFGAVIILYLLLLIPEGRPPQPKGAGKEAFVWNRDAFWSELENRFRIARELDNKQRSALFNHSLEQIHHTLDTLAETNLPPETLALETLEKSFFEFAPLAAACPEQLIDFINVATRMRQLVKWQSENWPADSTRTRQKLYRLLYGSRAAIEEVLLQTPGATNALTIYIDQDGADSPVLPAVTVQGVKLQSGDILVSRGGAATSALIARGNDYPGNFSHVALVHVDATTQTASVVEAHIESGVSVRPIEKYLSDTKLRILVLRLRKNLPNVSNNAELPHRAASLALRNSLARHIPYDFAMDYTDSQKQFCSEVAGAAYRSVGITLWTNLSHISTPGVTSWLAALGVRHFETQEPSDLEYDPQLRLVAEWREPATLFEDHLDNVVIDVMLEAAERGATLDYKHWQLPAGRVAKAWSVVNNWFGQIGPVPEGMSATTALRVQKLKANHATIKARLHIAARKFKTENGYEPPYWELLRLAREILKTP